MPPTLYSFVSSEELVLLQPNSL